MVWLLLDRGGDTKATDYADRTPLHIAALNGSEVMVGLLLNRGANTEATDYSNQTPFHSSASLRGHVTAIRLLLDRAIGRTTTNYNTPHPHQICKWVGITQDPAHTERHRREGRETEIGAKVAFTTTQSAGRGGTLDMPWEGAATGEGARGGRKRSSSPRQRREWEWETPTRGRQNVFFSFSFLSLLFSEDWGEGDQGAPL